MVRSLGIVVAVTFESMFCVDGVSSVSTVDAEVCSPVVVVGVFGMSAILVDEEYSPVVLVPVLCVSEVLCVICSVVVSDICSLLASVPVI